MKRVTEALSAVVASASARSQPSLAGSSELLQKTSRIKLEQDTEEASKKEDQGEASKKEDQGDSKEEDAAKDAAKVSEEVAEEDKKEEENASKEGDTDTKANPVGAKTHNVVPKVMREWLQDVRLSFYAVVELLKRHVKDEAATTTTPPGAASLLARGEATLLADMSLISDALVSLEQISGLLPNDL